MIVIFNELISNNIFTKVRYILKRINILQDVRQRLTNRAAQLEEIHKANKLLSEWLQDIEAKITPEDNLLYGDLGEKRANLEKYRALLREISSHSELVSKVFRYMLSMAEKYRYF